MFSPVPWGLGCYLWQAVVNELPEDFFLGVEESILGRSASKNKTQAQPLSFFLLKRIIALCTLQLRDRVCRTSWLRHMLWSETGGSNPSSAIYELFDLGKPHNFFMPQVLYL